jgi:tRNA(fMet)-specific endonuclease VapC
MGGNKHFLDSNIIIDLFRGNDEIEAFLKLNNSFYVPVIVLGELLFGAENALNLNKRFKQVNDFLSDFKIVTINEETAKVYGKSKQNLKKLENQFSIMIFGLPHFPFNTTIL